MKPLKRMLAVVAVTGLLSGSALTVVAASAAPSARTDSPRTAQSTSGAVFTDIRFGSWDGTSGTRNRVQLDFEVANPDPGHHYILRTVADAPEWDDAWWGDHGRDVEVDTDPTSPGYGQGSQSIVIDAYDANLLPGAVHTFWIDAYDGDPYDGGTLLWNGTPTEHQMPQLVGHPTAVDVVGKFDDSRTDEWGQGRQMIVGETYTIRSTGTWEEGTTFYYNIWVEGLESAWTLEEESGAARHLESFTPTAEHIETGIHINIFGNKEGRVSHSYGWLFGVVDQATPEVPTPEVPTPEVPEPPVLTPEKPTAVKALPKAWVKSYGKKKGQVRVARSVRVTKPNFSKAGKKQKLKVTYQWFSGGKAIKGAKAKKRTFKLRKAQRNKRLTVKVTVTKKGYKSRTKTISFGKVKAARKR